MGYSNPPIPWSQFERALSDKRNPGSGHAGDGGDSPAWSRKREKYVPPSLRRDDSGPVVPYAELHAHSTFSFLDGASGPEHLFEEAARLHLHGLALTDHDGFYGAARMAEVAEAYPTVTTVYGTELSLGLTEPQNGVPDPEGTHLLLLADGLDGYTRLAAAVTRAHLAAGAEKGRPRYDLDELAAQGDGHWRVLTGCRKGAVRQALERGGESAAEDALRALLDRFGTTGVVVELIDQGDPMDTARNDTLAMLAAKHALTTVATGNVHYATPDRFPVATALAAVRARRSLDEIDGWLPAAPTAHLRSGAEMARRFARYPGAVEHSVELADELGFRLKTVKPGLPHVEVPEGHTSMSWLRELTWRGARRFYPGSADGVDPQKRERIERELSVIEDKDFPGYFLIVRDMVQYARQRGILCQGRGSAANSAVCYLLEITAVDSIRYGLPFERFLSAMRDEEPDIDVDFDSDRREEVIQYVYDKYGRFNAAQVANVITYRPKGAVRDMAKALGHSPGQQDAWSKQVERWGSVTESQDHDIPDTVVDMAQQVLGFPRHLGIHSGGMVLTDRPVGEVVPIEHARMDGRTVLQWDKDDCAYMGLVKFDMLGLGMLAALQYSFDLADEHCGERWDMHSIPKEEQGVYDQLCRADTIGVFQVESRAQMGTLPRLLPRRFYDLVIEVALVRPGPIQGGAVHPYIRRRTGEEPITYIHPSLEPVLERTLGVPLFQEQLMQMAIAVGGCSGGRWGPSAGTRRSTGCGTSSTRAWRRTTSTARTPTPSTRRSRPSRTSASRRATRSASRSSSTRVRGCVCTTRARSSRHCCVRNRWASTRRRRWWRTPDGTACRSAGRTSCGPGWTPRWNRWMRTAALRTTALRTTALRTTRRRGTSLRVRTPAWRWNSPRCCRSTPPCPTTPHGTVGTAPSRSGSGSQRSRRSGGRAPSGSSPSATSTDPSPTCPTSPAGSA
jgi:error-prone DNA polymerase